jgi:hypothetical protein
MPILTRSCNPTFPPCCPLQGYPDPNAPETYDYGFKRLVPLLQSPPVGAGILSITFFFLIAFFSNVLLAQISLATLGITVTLGTLGLLTLIILTLFVLF